MWILGLKGLNSTKEGEGHQNLLRALTLNRDASCDLPVIYKDVFSRDSQITYMYI